MITSKHRGCVRVKKYFWGRVRVNMHGRKGNSSIKRGQFLHVGFQKKERRRVLGRAPAMMCLKASIVGLCLCCKRELCACKIRL
jgi:hypothetical protein